MFQILDSISYCLSKRILNRYLKPEDILIDLSLKTLKLADIGIATRVENSDQPLMEEWYRAPEILLGSTKYTTAVDVWSAGCIFAEIVTTGILFMGNSEIDPLVNIYRWITILARNSIKRNMDGVRLVAGFRESIPLTFLPRYCSFHKDGMVVTPRCLVPQRVAYSSDWLCLRDSRQQSIIGSIVTESVSSRECRAWFPNAESPPRMHSNTDYFGIPYSSSSSS